MKCPIETRESAELLLAYCTRKLDAESTAILERHMEVCPACREFASGQRAVWQALEAWEAAPVTSDFDRRLYRRIDREVSWWHLLMRPLRPVLVRQGLPIAAAACLLVMAGVLLERPAGVPRSAPQPQSAQVEAFEPDQVDHALDAMRMLGEFSNRMPGDAADSKM
jgi:anti-sigma factor RsiW